MSAREPAAALAREEREAFEEFRRAIPLARGVTVTRTIRHLVCCHVERMERRFCPWCGDRLSTHRSYFITITTGVAISEEDAASCPWCKHGEHLDAACACGCPPLSRVSLTNDRPAARKRGWYLWDFDRSEVVRGPFGNAAAAGAVRIEIEGDRSLWIVTADQIDQWEAEIARA